LNAGDYRVKEEGMQSILRGGQVMNVVTGEVSPADVLIDGERIAAVGRSQEFGSDNGAAVIDVTGLTIMPGLANNHVHLGWDGLGWDGGPFGTLRDQGVNDSRAVTALKSAVNLKKSLSVGLTAIRDLGMNMSNIDAAEGMARDVIAGPRLYHTGRAIMCTGGHTWWCGREADGVDEVTQAVREQIKAGSSWIKVMASERLPQYGLDELKAMSEETHRQGKRITAHATIPDAIRNVVDAGFDCIEHGGPADDDVLEEIVRKGVFVVPTLSPMFLQTERGPAAGMPEHIVEARKKRFAANPPGEGPRRMAEAGVKMAFGTDAGSPCVPHDEILAEMQKLIEVGVAKRPLDVIQMLTVNSAELLGESANFGTVETGKYADLVLVEGNPAQNIDDIANVQHVFLGGKRVFGMSDRPQVLV
jgi:imidazolonepropionase-like amidohydrolase